MQDRDFGPARLGRSTKEAEFHQARLEAIQAFLIESKVPVEEEVVLPIASRHRSRRFLLVTGPFAAAALTTAAICGGGEKNGGGGQEGNQPPPVTRQDEGLRLPFADGEQWYITAGPHYDPKSKSRVRYALDFVPKKRTNCPGGAPDEDAHVVAVDDGTVVVVGDEDNTSDSNNSVVEIKHENGGTSGYMHLDNIPVKEGQE